MTTFINVILLIIAILSGNGYGNAAEIEMKANPAITAEQGINDLDEMDELEVAIEEELGHDFDSDEIDCEEDVIWLNCSSWESCEELFEELI